MAKQTSLYIFILMKTEKPSYESPETMIGDYFWGRINKSDLHSVIVNLKRTQNNCKSQKKLLTSKSQKQRLKGT